MISPRPVDSTFEAISRRLARSLTRRSLFGQVGRGSIAMALGSTLAGAGLERAVFPGTAMAGACGCAESLSVACGHLTGDNHCPPGTCNCGAWIICGSGGGLCPNQNTRWGDCCGNCNGATCVAHDGTTSPSCCNPLTWGAPGCSGSSYHVKCRVWSCTSNPCNCPG